jgi:hypothetical protein
VLERMWALGERKREEALAGLSDTERRALVDSLLKIRANLSERGGHAPLALFVEPGPRRGARHG